MTLIFEKNNCKLIRHHNPVQNYQDSKGNVFKYQLKDILFQNFKRKQKLVKNEENNKDLKARIESFLSLCKIEKLFSITKDEVCESLKTENIKLMNDFYDISNDSAVFHGENNLEIGKLTELNGAFYLIPPQCRFFNNKIESIKEILPPNEANNFDFIVIDPPWKNRYIKRVKKSTGHKQGYNTMSDDK